MHIPKAVKTIKARKDDIITMSRLLFLGGSSSIVLLMQYLGGSMRLSQTALNISETLRLP